MIIDPKTYFNSSHSTFTFCIGLNSAFFHKTLVDQSCEAMPRKVSMIFFFFFFTSFCPMKLKFTNYFTFKRGPNSPFFSFFFHFDKSKQNYFSQASKMTTRVPIGYKRRGGGQRPNYKMRRFFYSSRKSFPKRSTKIDFTTNDDNRLMPRNNRLQCPYSFSQFCSSKSKIIDFIGELKIALTLKFSLL